MAGEWITIAEEEGKTFEGYLAMPSKEGAPCLVVVQEIYGVNAVIRNYVDSLAEAGYIVLAPDLFWRQEHRIDLDYSPESQAKGISLYKAIDYDQTVADLGKAVEKVRRSKGSIGRVGVIGFCFGGRVAFLGAARLNVQGVVAFYPGGIDQHLSEVPELGCPVMFHFGMEDTSIPLETVAKVEAAVADRPGIWVHQYPGVGHAFYLPGRSGYDAAAAEKAEERTTDMLRQVMPR